MYTTLCSGLWNMPRNVLWYFRYWTTERPRGVQSQYHAVRRMCRERGVVFEDPEFPPGPRVLFHHKKPPVHPIVWMRPGVSVKRKKVSSFWQMHAIVKPEMDVQCEKNCYSFHEVERYIDLISVLRLERITILSMQGMRQKFQSSVYNVLVCRSVYCRRCIRLPQSWL